MNNINTNLDKTKGEIIFELVKSLNNGNSGYIDRRVGYATQQYNELVDAGIITEITENDN